MHENILMKWLVSGSSPRPRWRRGSEGGLIEERPCREARADPDFALPAYLQKEATPKGEEMRLLMRVLAVAALALAVVVAHHLSWYGFRWPQASAPAVARDRSQARAEPGGESP
jgi:hypothetical protein